MPATRAPKRAAGRWNPALEGTILDATLAAVAELGYDRMTMDDLATRAGVGKAAIYRRWSSKGEVVAEAIAHWRRSLGPAPTPDTGTLRGDLDALVDAIHEYDAAEMNMFRVVIGVATAAMRDPVLSAALDDLVLSVPRQVLRSILDRAVTRGEISATRDVTLLPDAVLGLNILRMISGRPIDRIYVRRVLDDVVLPLATAPPA
ncbi:TetR/AcrR family transcriptional regulator [Mycobacterium sp. CBMA293]|uniref:TetR/AcrR family transcriptional regulator n=1 Tax=unclassified Mycolicibacterium TaxID=2636767 RepID=UPI0012DF0B5E|nr:MULTISPECIES: TetR/AcrR family transcriptional regulator [unclassified Mycolicibacterium]MUL47294.1 TetR/AcrR family transcriptional regulator [Mycolicibacterium sp. CBMA 360]MUL61405.1 TetR/AcrR family transcriptional regulator [Mycolicibacterium sp. CBMA 335]MUL72140.1 TetR/AcrR family transcriptional regulator [Mycolicibacterium sp. CBMA 311]MUL96307.1 TetR/AcrR family transcriptional regulator [Mycolicibacterium sp. CBMA 230]MUM08870.1 TetR family transcriptional regulator [Mycolicibact